MNWNSAPCLVKWRPNPRQLILCIECKGVYEIRDTPHFLCVYPCMDLTMINLIVYIIHVVLRNSSVACSLPLLALFCLYMSKLKHALVSSQRYECLLRASPFSQGRGNVYIVNNLIDSDLRYIVLCSGYKTLNKSQTKHSTATFLCCLFIID